MILGTEAFASGLAELAVDAVRLVHLLAVAVGLGTMVSTDISTLRRIERPVNQAYSDTLEAAHDLMMPALLIAWISGILLIGIRTGFDVTAFSPKLWMKLMVVGLLTSTAVAIKWRVMPIIQAAHGTTLMEVSLRDKLVLATCAGLSMSGWGTALVLGASTFFKTADWTTLLVTVFAIYAGVIGMAIRAAFVLHRRVTDVIVQSRRIAAE